MKGLDDKDIDIYNNQSSVQDCINSVDLDMQKLIEQELLHIIFVPFFINMIGDNVTEQQAREKLEEFERAIEETKAVFHDPNFWMDVISFFRQLLTMWGGKNYTQEDNLSIPHDHPMLKFLWYLLRSISPNLSPQVCLKLQLVCTNFLLDQPHQSKAIWRGLGKFLHSY